MKIAYRTAGAGGYTDLANESPAAGSPELGLSTRISGYQPKLAASPQEEPGFNAAGIAVFDNGNKKWALAFTAERVHATPDAALAFLSAHPIAWATLGNLDLQITVGGQVTYLPACAVTEFTPDPHSDQSTKCRYAFVGGSYTTTAP